jgi:hypothetical protein
MDARAMQKPLKDRYRARAEKTEQYCVVIQTLTKPPRIETEWT